MNRDLYSLRATPLSPVSASMHGKSHPNENPHDARTRRVATTPGTQGPRPRTPQHGTPGNTRVTHATPRDARAEPASRTSHHTEEKGAAVGHRDVRTQAGRYGSHAVRQRASQGHEHGSGTRRERSAKARRRRRTWEIWQPRRASESEQPGPNAPRPKSPAGLNFETKKGEKVGRCPVKEIVSDG